MALFGTIQPVKAPRKELDQPKNLIPCAQPAGFDQRLTALQGPGIGKRASLGKTHLILDELTSFDTVGMAIQDIVTAAMLYKGALEKGVGTRYEFFK